MYNLALECRLQCQCDILGSTGPSCDIQTGQCICKPKIGGLKCTLCEPGFYNLTRFGCVNKCDCDLIGSLNQYCSSQNGQCLCKQGYTGRKCDKCLTGYSRETDLTECKKCTCNINGIMDYNNICDQTTGKCICNDQTDGFECNQCKPGYFGNLTSLNNSTCQKCSCDTLGTDPNTLVNGNYVCNSNTSQCSCNPNRIGVRCETCALGFFFLNLNGIDCLECNCDPIGSVPGSNCDSLTGECVCKTSNGIGGTRCDQCSAGYYNFSKITGS